MEDEVARRIDAAIRVTRESLAYAAPEVHDDHWAELRENVESIVRSTTEPQKRRPLDAAKADWRWPWARGVEYVVQEGTSFWRELREAHGYSREDVWDLTGAIVTPARLAEVEGDYALGAIFDLDDLHALAEVYGRSPGELLDASYDSKGCALVAEAMEEQGEEGPPAVEVAYRNHRGEEAVRRVTPFRVRYGSTDHHPEPQFLLEVLDHDRMAARTYALADCDFRHSPSVEASA